MDALRGTIHFDPMEDTPQTFSRPQVARDPKKQREFVMLCKRLEMLRYNERTITYGAIVYLTFTETSYPYFELHRNGEHEVIPTLHRRRGINNKQDAAENAALWIWARRNKEAAA